MGLSEGDVDGRAAAALFVLIHPVVVDQEEALQDLERRARVDRVREVARGIDGVKCAGERDRTHPLPPSQGQLAQALEELDGVRGEREGLAASGVEVRHEARLHAGAHIGEERLDPLFLFVHPDAVRNCPRENRQGTAAERGCEAAEIMARSATMSADIHKRKADHLDLCATDDVAFRERTTLLECVRFIHQSLPDLHVDEIDLGVDLLGKRLRAPIVIAAMTGGHERAAEVNRTLASIAEERGYGFGLGSQRAMQKSPETAWTFQVREHAPSALILGNVGVVQARDLSSDAVAEMLETVGADALCVHMNPAMELIQAGGDRDFRGGVETFERLVDDLELPIVAKETGNGISRGTAIRLRGVGVRHLDTSGAGGTSWVGVETLRAEGAARSLGEQLWDWGIPTAASVRYAVGAGMITIATGGIRSGLDIARALALGATAGGIARHVYMALLEGGREGAETFLRGVEDELRAVMLLVGAKDLDSLRDAPRVITGELKDWGTGSLS